ncbi:MAG: hypothetical protein WBD25_22285 [Terriglobales bacterium]
MRFAIAERPIFLRHFHQIDEDILAANLQAFVQSVRNGFVEALLHLNCTAAIQSDLQKDAIVRSMNAKIISIKLQIRFVVLCDDLEAVVLRDS